MASDWTPATIDAGISRETTTFPTARTCSHRGGDVQPTAAPYPHPYAGVRAGAPLSQCEHGLLHHRHHDGVSSSSVATQRGRSGRHLSLGSQFGPHDGTSAFESGLSAMTGPGDHRRRGAEHRQRQFHAEVFAAGAGRMRRC